MAASAKVMVWVFTVSVLSLLVVLPVSFFYYNYYRKEEEDGHRAYRRLVAELPVAANACMCTCVRA